MRQQLRLAEARDVFKRISISEVAEFGLMILQMLDERSRQDREVFDIKAALASAAPKKLPELFPQWFPDETVEIDEAAEEMLAAGTAVEDYSQVQFLSPKDAEMDEMMRLSEALLAASHVSISGDDSGEWM